MQNTFPYKLPRADLELVVEQCGAEIALLDRKVTLITGGTGFIGKCLLESILFAAEHLDINPKLVVVSRNPAAFLKQNPWLDQPRLTFLQSDITRFEFFRTRGLYHSRRNRNGFSSLRKNTAGNAPDCH